MTIRPFREEDRDRVLALLGERWAIDSPSHHLQVLEASTGSTGLEAGVAGVALWVEPDAGEEAYLGLVAVTAGPAPGDWRPFYRLVAGCAREAVDRGFGRGYFSVHDRGLLGRIQRDFDVRPEPSGWDPATREPVQWEVHVDLQDALRQLERVT